MADLVIFSTPKEATITLTCDNGVVVQGVSVSLGGREDAHVLSIPFSTGGMGAHMRLICQGYVTVEHRGILISEDGIATYTVDDIRMTPTPVTPGPEPPPVDPTYPKDPEGIINYVFAIGSYDLSTHEGCGKFTEDCCEALHDHHNNTWGHIRKNPGQNQYNGHAVDAVQQAAGPGNGIYDIIHDSISTSATPSFNYKGEPDLTLWYYPA